MCSFFFFHRLSDLKYTHNLELSRIQKSLEEEKTKKEAAEEKLLKLEHQQQRYGGHDLAIDIGEEDNRGEAGGGGGNLELGGTGNKESAVVGRSITPTLVLQIPFKWLVTGSGDLLGTPSK